MNFVADESVDQPIITHLRDNGHTVKAVVEMEPGITDETVLDLANQENAMLLTADKDFGELVFRDCRYAFGIILLRLSGLPPKAKSKIVADAISDHSDKIPQTFTVISSHTVRIRPKIL